MRKLGMAAALISAVLSSNAGAAVLHPKVVILGYFETSKAYGEKGYWGDADKPGELHHWIEGLNLKRRLPVKGAFNPVWANADGSIIAMKIGPNSLHPAVNLMALGLDANFDLSRSYWLINGIAGTSPETGTIGDLIWTDFVVNGDVAHEIDAREIPADWPEGYFPAGRTGPYPEPRVAAGSPEDVRGWTGPFRTNRARTVTMLNASLARWAYRLTVRVALPDNAGMRAVREEYDQARARSAPEVAIGSTLSSETFWLGGRLDAWARRWVAYMTDGRGTFRTTETNDAGAMVALSALGRAGRVDPDRVLLLRAASNFDMPPRGVPASEQLVREGPQSFAGYLPALDGLYRVGAPVVHEIVRGWPTYSKTPPK
ncbi:MULTISPECIES: purine-nucleoside phosphorylase [Sphingomonas]|uniref:purine-nucleoside phosphorylase n=2 Tax=Sphingomonas TaxID=13687 RepID=UPI000964A33A|nr:purine nucleoside permease [Sphingomonas sp.]OJY49318.1 MAG: hypothetical protein BGP17_11930 [Sphingomonas sp. 67-41]